MMMLNARRQKFRSNFHVLTLISVFTTRQRLVKVIDYNILAIRLAGACIRISVMPTKSYMAPREVV